jgi:hypothetical protein
VTFGGQVQDSTTMNTPTVGSTSWMQQTMSFVANAASQSLSFLGVGVAGTPPIAYLDGVSLTQSP